MSTNRNRTRPLNSILHASTDQSVIVVDIPRSIEEAQVRSGQVTQRRLLSSQPPSKPWSLPEPKGAKDQDLRALISPAAAIAELMASWKVSTALESAQSSHNGVWCLPRTQVAERKGDRNQGQAIDTTVIIEDELRLLKEKRAGFLLPYIPTGAHYVLGTIEAGCTELVRRAPAFDLIVLDPPWPSRSVRRKKTGNTYATVSNISEARELLSRIPVAAKLKPNGLVAVWITNKAAIHDLLTAPEHGIFAQWGLELAGEWIWLKITSAGEPIFDLESQWRKPWERLLFARPKQRSCATSVDTNDATNNMSRGIPAKVILAVPDLHSRKPNLRALLQEYLPSNYQGLEVFARNLTAGWWSWGNEVLLFQGPEHWVQQDEEENHKLE